MLKGFGKWITLALTTAAAVIGLLVNARNLGLTPWLNVQGVSFADLAARRVSVAPTIAVIDAVGDTLLLAATVADERGSTVAGASLVWRTDDSSVVVVDSSGTAVARGPGTATVSVSVRDFSARTRVVVSQKLARLSLTGDSTLSIRENSEAKVTALALDSRGHPIRSMTPEWHSANPDVATVDPRGRVVALALGQSRLTATLDNRTASVVVNVLLAPASVGVVSGADQRFGVGRSLPEQIVIQVLSLSGLPVPGISVRLAPAGGQGAARPPLDTTDSSGRVSAVWTLSAAPGRQRLLVTANGVESTLTITAEADPVKTNTRLRLLGEGLKGRVGAQLPQEVTVRVTDSLGRVLTDVPVTWTALNGGSVESLAPRTDSLGVARARWTLGQKLGAQVLHLQAGNPRTMAPYPIVAQAMSGLPAGLKILAGGGQRGAVGRRLPVTLAVQVTDLAGNQVPDVVVFARAVGGELDDTIHTSDAAGRALFRWTLGRSAGRQEVEFRAANLDTVLRVGARALPLSPANIAVLDSPVSGVPGRVVPVSVLVSDEYGNPVPDVPITFSVKSGALSAARVMTDAQGHAGSQWTPGPTLGDHVITATVRGAGLKATYAVTVAAGRRR
jgi:hypothetical protein